MLYLLVIIFAITSMLTALINWTEQTYGTETDIKSIVLITLFIYIPCVISYIGIGLILGPITGFVTAFATYIVMLLTVHAAKWVLKKIA